MAKYKTLDSYTVGNQNTDQDFMDMLTDIQNSNNTASAAAADRANEFTSQSQETAMSFNAEEAAKNRAFQASMSNTAHQREVRDLVRAGLNPVLSANNGAAVTSGAAGSVSGAQGIKAEMDMQKAQLFAQYYMNKANNANAVKMNNDQIASALAMRTMDNATALQQSRLAAAASMYGANASAAATRYAASQAAAATAYAADQANDASKYGARYGYKSTKNTNKTKKEMQEEQLIFDAFTQSNPLAMAGAIAWGAYKGFENFYSNGGKSSSNNYPTGTYSSAK